MGLGNQTMSPGYGGRGFSDNAVYTRVLHGGPSRGFNSSAQTAHTSDHSKHNFYWDPFCFESSQEDFNTVSHTGVVTKWP